MKQSIITVEQAKTLGRPIGKVSNDKIQSMITEVEQTIIRKSLGESLYLSLLEDEIDDVRQMLLNGGIYETMDSGKHIFKGLLVCIAYYVYAQNVMTGDFESTRFGMVIKEGDYSQRISSKERSDIYNNATSVANDYLKDCLIYCKNVGLEVSRMINSSTAGCVIRKIRN